MSQYKLVQELEEGIVRHQGTLHSQLSGLVDGFVRYLKEPRYQSPLTLQELSRLFGLFYKDLNSVAFNLYCLSNTSKKQLINNCGYFRDHRQDFDYLMAIANYLSSSIKLVKRSDELAMKQLRIFNLYKFHSTLHAIELAHNKLFQTVAKGEDVMLYDKIFRFDQKDVIFQEFLDEKLEALRKENICFSMFYHDDSETGLAEFMDSLVESKDTEFNSQLEQLTEQCIELKQCITPLSKILTVSHMQRNITRLLKTRFPDLQISNDILLPSFIYLALRLLELEEMYLTFIFISNFLDTFDPYHVEVHNITVSSTYNPTDSSNPMLKYSYKPRVMNFFEMLNISNTDERTSTEVDYINHKSNNSNNDHNDDHNDMDFFPDDKSLIQYILSNEFFSGELKYCLTNFEAMVTYLSCVTLEELDPTAHTTNKLLKAPLSSIVDLELDTHFKFPEGMIEEETKSREVATTTRVESRSRSSSIMNAINNKINESRSRSNSSNVPHLKRDCIPPLTHGSDTESSAGSPSTVTEEESNNGINMMKNLIGRFSSLSVTQFNGHGPGPNQGIMSASQNGSSEGQVPRPDGLPADDQILFTAHRRSGSSLMNRLSPNNSRTRSSSLELGIPHGRKSNSVTSKFTSGVSEFMQKLNNVTPNNSTGNIPTISALGGNGGGGGGSGLLHNGSHGSLNSLENGSRSGADAANSMSNDPTPTVHGRRPDFSSPFRARTTSLQIMDRWFGNISSQSTTNPQSPTGASALNTTLQASALTLTPGTSNAIRGSGEIRGLSFAEITRFQLANFDQLSVNDLRTLKSYYDHLCQELIGIRSTSATTIPIESNACVPPPTTTTVTNNSNTANNNTVPGDIASLATSNSDNPSTLDESI